MNYLYYTIFVCATKYNKRPGAHKRTAFLFALIFAQYAYGFLCMSGLLHRKHYESFYTAFLMLAIYYYIFKLYFESDGRGIKIINHYDAKAGQKHTGLFMIFFMLLLIGGVVSIGVGMQYVKP